MTASAPDSDRARIRPACDRDPVLADRDGVPGPPEGLATGRIEIHRGPHQVDVTWPTTGALRHALYENGGRQLRKAALGAASGPEAAIFTFMMYYTTVCLTSAPEPVPGRSVVNVTVIPPKTPVSCA